MRKRYLYYSSTTIDGVDVEFLVTRAGEVKFAVDGRERPSPGKYPHSTGIRILLWVKAEWEEVLDLGVAGEYFCIPATPELGEAYEKVGFRPDYDGRYVYYV